MPEAITPERFNLRVYGVWISHERQVLLTQEQHQQAGELLKFPGGGVNHGEGPLDALRREWREETGLAILSAEHLYTTEFFQRSAFDPCEQIISIYYRLSAPDTPAPQPQAGAEAIVRFRWEALEELPAEQLSMPIDRHVWRLLQQSPR